MGIITGILGVIGAAASAIATGAAMITSSASIIFGVIYGGYAVCKSLASRKASISSSPTYNGTLQTQVNNQLPLALIYGENKLAGNVIWQELTPQRDRIRKLVAFGEGPLDSISDCRANDIPVANLASSSAQPYLGASTAQISDFIPGATLNDKIKTVGSLKNVAYVLFDVKFTSDVSANFNATAIVKGRKVRVYTTPNVYTVKYSANPAWCLLDFLTAYNGCGIGLKEDGSSDDALIKELIDIDSFIDAASFCDQTIEGKPRFSFNMIFDSTMSRRDIIEEFKKSCRGALVMKGKQLQFKIDKSSTPCKAILPSDIIAGSEEVTTLPTEENYDRIIVKYRSKAHEWAIVETYAEKDTFDNVPPIEHSVEIYSVIEHHQATRLAWYYLNKVNLERVFGYFETDYRVFDLEIGDVITLSDNLMKYNAKSVKITRLIDKNDGTFGVYWREYNPSLYLDTPGALAPTVTETSSVDVFAPPPDVQFFNIVQNNNLYLFSWQPVAKDGVTYEIRSGESWDSATVLGTDITSATFSTIIRSTGLKTFFIKAKNSYGIFSAAPAVYSINITDIPSLNIVLQEDLLASTPQKLDECYVYNGVLKLTPAGVWKLVDSLNWQTTAYYAIDGSWGGAVVSAGSMTTAVYDLGMSVKSYLSLEYESNETQENSSVRIYIRCSDDGEIWSDWKLFANEERELRFYQFKIDLTSSDMTKLTVKNLVFTIDVEDRDEYYKGIIVENAREGLLLDFATNPQSKLKRAFCSIPAVVANTSDGTSGYCSVTAKSPSSCVIKVFNNQNQPVTARIDVHVKGY